MGLLDALASGVQAAATTGAEYVGKVGLEQERQKLELEKAQRVLEMQKTATDNARTERAGRIEESRQGLINRDLDTAMGKRFSDIDAMLQSSEAEGGVPLTQEQKDYIEKYRGDTKDALRRKAEGETSYYVRGGVQTGDYDAKELATLDAAARKQNLEELKLDQNERKMDIQEKANQQRFEAMMAKIGSGSSGGGSSADKVAGHQFISSINQEIKGLRDDRSKIQKQLGNAALSDTEKKDLNDQVAAISRTIKRRTDSIYEYSKGLGINLPKGMMDDDESAGGSPKPSAKTDELFPKK